MKLKELRKLIREEISSIRTEQQSLTQEDYLLLIWDNNSPDPLRPNLMLVIASDNELDLDIPKGELADSIEKYTNAPVDVSDFEEEIISFEDFMEEYGDINNPDRIDINKVKVVKI